MSKSNFKKDYDRLAVPKKVTEFVANLMEEKGIIPWVRPWNGSEVKNYVTKGGYVGFNNLILSAVGSRYYLTAKQVAYLDGERWEDDENGNHILKHEREWKIKLKKGSQGIPIVFSKPIPYAKIVTNENGEEEEKIFHRFVWKSYTVFRIEDVEGITLTEDELKTIEFKPIAECEEFLNACPCPIYYGSDSAFYSPNRHVIHLPDKENFTSSESFYTTAFHEMSHATGHPSIFGRFDLDKLDGFGSESCSYEELVAEISMSHLAFATGIMNPFETKNTKAYIKGWAGKLRKNPEWMLKACTQAEKVYEYYVNRVKGGSGYVVYDTAETLSV